jgi:hypothetical protein
MVGLKDHLWIELEEERMTGDGDTRRRIDSAAIERGTYGALLDVLDAAGYYPITREDILHAIERGVRDAVTDYLERRGLPPGSAA